MENPRILSTKKIPTNLIEKLKINKINCDQEDFIKIHPIEFNPMLINLGPNNWIITSKNAWRLLKDKFTPAELKEKTIFCVGEKTKAEIESCDCKAHISTKNSKSLAKYILDHYPNNSFQYFCGSHRMKYLPNLFHDNNIDWVENKIYKTELTPIKDIANYNAILFFSPSGVQSYLELNQFSDEKLFAIGQTTAEALSKYENTTIISDNQSVESVIDSVIKHYT